MLTVSSFGLNENIFIGNLMGIINILVHNIIITSVLFIKPLYKIRYKIHKQFQKEKYF